MAGRIKSRENCIEIYPPHLSVHYRVELEESNHITVWIVTESGRFRTTSIPFDVIPYMDILIQRRTAVQESQLPLSELARC